MRTKSLNCVVYIVSLFCAAASAASAELEGMTTIFRSIADRKQIFETIQRHPRGLELISWSQSALTQPLMKQTALESKFDINQDRRFGIGDFLNFRQLNAAQSFCMGLQAVSDLSDEPTLRSSTLQPLLQRIKAQALTIQKRGCTKLAASATATSATIDQLQIDTLLTDVWQLLRRLEQLASDKPQSASIERYLLQVRQIPRSYEDYVEVKWCEASNLHSVDYLASDLLRDVISALGCLPANTPRLQLLNDQAVSTNLSNYYKELQAWASSIALDLSTVPGFSETVNEFTAAAKVFVESQRRFAALDLRTVPIDRQQFTALSPIKLDGNLVLSGVGSSLQLRGMSEKLLAELLEQNMGIASAPIRPPQPEQLKILSEFALQLFRPVAKGRQLLCAQDRGVAEMLASRKALLLNRQPPATNSQQAVKANEKWSGFQTEPLILEDSDNDPQTKRMFEVEKQASESCAKSEYTVECRQLRQEHIKLSNEVMGLDKGGVRKSQYLQPEVIAFLRVVAQIANLGVWTLDLNHDGEIDDVDLHLAETLKVE